MFKKSTFFMRVIVALLGLVILIPCLLFLPRVLEILSWIAKEILGQEDSFFWILDGLIYVALYIALIPFLMAIYQTLKLLGYIDEKETFSEKTVKALKVIRNCATAILVIFIVGAMPTAIYGEVLEEIIMGAALSLIPMAIAVFASMLMNLIKEAIEIKSENDLTI